ncbi:Dihydrolipoamide acetyltransferase component of pyruvate dehydrogenase complex [Psychrobacter okhotskensis]|uniref:2-oxo acid dehydrogenase subunit E2 n=1 Tax=Psychrobacter TaxID=497 RepID=UPI00191B361B|nr:2-oxo acid dehydrogenase subunit E2 [Psychrobacter immobilis]
MDIKAPDLGVDSAEVSEIMVEVGDVIEKDDNIILLESDKASVEVPSSAAGTVTKISVAVGDQVSEGMVLIELDSDTGTDSEDSGNESNDAEADDQQAPENNAASADSVDAENDDKEKAQEDEQASSVSDSAADSAPSSGKATTHALPDLGVDEAQVSEIMVSVGDMVSADQSILLIESDKASVEVPAPEAGKIEKILVEAGDMVANGQDFIVIISSGSEADSANKSANESKTESKTDKQTSSNDQKQAAAEPKQASVKETSTSTPTQSADNKLTETQVNEKLVDVYAGPAVRKLARQLGVDISQVTGSAINERILKEDLFAHVKQSLTNKQAAPASSGTASRASLPSLPDMSNAEIWGETEVQDLSRLQKVSIPQLNYNTYLPQVTQFDLSDITETEKLRGELKGGMKAEGIGFTILAFVVKATAYALTQHPRFNSHLSDDNSQIILRKSVNMGIAVATDDGLIVPVIKNVQDKGLKQIAIEIGELAVKARDKKLSTKDLQGASFTISSQGNLGGTAFTPLVNWPQVGILGVSEASMQPRWNESSQSFEPRLMLPLSLSYDHRVINGADAAVFTRYIATLLADPRRILL